jgi:cob(I)alamin adenosyltransferase
MTEEPENLTLIILRRIETRMTSMEEKLDRMCDDLRDVKVRLSSMDENMAVVQRRLDRLDDRLDRVERRLGLIEAPH